MQWEWMRGEQVDGEEGERGKSWRRIVQWSSYWECTLSVMVEVALGFAFFGKGGHKMVHKSLVLCIKRARKLLPVRIFFFFFCQLSD